MGWTYRKCVSGCPPIHVCCGLRGGRSGEIAGGLVGVLDQCRCCYVSASLARRERSCYKITAATQHSCLGQRAPRPACRTTSAWPVHILGLGGSIRPSPPTRCSSRLAGADSVCPPMLPAGSLLSQATLNPGGAGGVGGGIDGAYGGWSVLDEIGADNHAVVRFGVMGLELMGLELVGMIGKPSSVINMTCLMPQPYQPHFSACKSAQLCNHWSNFFSGVSKTCETVR